MKHQCNSSQEVEEEDREQRLALAEGKLRVNGQMSFQTAGAVSGHLALMAALEGGMSHVVDNCALSGRPSLGRMLRCCPTLYVPLVAMCP